MDFSSCVISIDFYKSGHKLGKILGADKYTLFCRPSYFLNITKSFP